MMRHYNDKRFRRNNVSRTLTPLARDVTYSQCCETHTPLRHNFALLNTRSLANKATLLNDMIIERKLDMLLLTETWQSPNGFMELNLLTPPGYYHLSEPRLTGRGGGLAAVIKNKYKTINIDFHAVVSFEYLSFRIAAEKMGKHKDLSEFDEGQIVMARRLDQSISKTAALLGCSRSAVVSICQQWSKEGTVVNQ
ncbi:hypothetical protein QTP70_014153 [Hemibagrus guttatus]|uniref:Uncharacterized protein n=1 Tax=Hemibagrus guttatus TaxID=175788 RepID=A0AAE0QNV5_9TELE|nr:hypothetical protein QTP70_014153 [Hemibagrus guttatus]